MLNKEKIKKEAKKIMDDFVKELEKVKGLKEEFGVRRKKNMRVSGFELRVSREEGFRERMFRNVPKKKGDYIQAEKKKW